MKRIYISLLITFVFLFFGTQNKLHGQCGTYGISANDSVVCIPQVVRFMVTGSPPAGTTHRWDFGNGWVNGKDTASHLFLIAGKFTVKLELTLPNTSKCVITNSDFIEAGKKPIINLSLDKSVLCDSRDSVTITDLTPRSKSRVYIMEGVQYNDVPKIYSHKFSSTPGTRDVSAIVTDSLGCRVIEVFNSLIKIPKTFSFNFTTDSTNGCTNRFANFKHFTLADGQKPISYAWTFENATPSNSTDSNANNVFYISQDSSDVSLSIKTQEGCTYTVSKKDYITLSEPISLLIDISKTDLCVGEKIEYKVSNSQSKKITWQFFPTDFVMQSSTDTTLKGEHRSSGAKIIRATQIYKGCVSQSDSRNQVTVKGPEARFTASKTVSCSNTETIIFTNTSVEPTGEIITYKWVIKNSNGTRVDSSTNKNFTRTFNTFGIFDVILIASSNTGGCSDTLNQINFIRLSKMTASSIVKPFFACISQPVILKSTTLLGSSAVPNLYTWRIKNKAGVVVQTDSKDSIIFGHASAAIFDYELIVRNTEGCYDSIVIKDSIRFIKPTISLTISDSTPCKNEIITIAAKLNPNLARIVHYWQFTNTSYPGAANNISFFRDSGAISFSEPGLYDLTYSYAAREGPRCKDTIKGTARIKVSGTNLAIVSTNNDDCIPLNTVLSSSITRTENFKNINPSFSYQWKSSDTFVKFTTPLANTTAANITGKGTKFARLVYTDRSDCKDSTALLPHFAGVSSNFTTSPQACLGSLAFFTNASTLKPTKYKWFSTDPSVLFLPNDSANNVSVKFNAVGRFPISLIAMKKNCRDTITYNIKSVEIKAKFYSPQPINQCAPVVVDFIDTSNNPDITRRFWEYGDGNFAQTGTNKITSHVYRQNTDTAGIDVRLTVQNNYGCADTLTKKNYVKILGPIPELVLENASGCEDLKVNFINKSKFFSRVFMEYGDGATLDSTNIRSHTYKIFDELNLAEFYLPKMVLYDNNGCFVHYTPKDSVYVVQNAIADFEVLKDTGCEVFRVTYINKSTRSSSYDWDFNNDGVTDSKAFNPFSFYNAGKHYPTLIARSPTNCFDTLKNKVEVYVHAKPNAKFSVIPDSTCYFFPVTAQDQSSIGADGAALKKWNYDFGEEFKLSDAYDIPNPLHKYNNLGNNIVKLVVEDANGCVDSTKKIVYIRDTLDPLNTGYSYITVTTDNKLILHWNKSKISVFKEYHIYNDEAGKINNLYNSNNISDTTFIVSQNIDVNSRRYCFTTKITDTCLRTGPVTLSHCNIYLRAMDTFLGATQLRWSHYEGWSRRLGYDIYRKAPGENFKFLATVNGNQNVYIDDSLCDVEYCYYVICRNLNPNITSRSNNACNTPEVEKPNFLPIIDYVTVVGNNQIALKWHFPPNKSILSATEIFRTNGANGIQGKKVGEVFATELSYLDNTAATNETAYTYFIKTRDICGNLSPISKGSHSIFLSGTNTNDTVFINWNLYSYWERQVNKYVVELRGNDGLMKEIGSVGININNYGLNTLDPSITDSLCFRVTAIEDSLIADTSRSNISCFAPKSRVFVPNAFSPNGDGKNELFKPVSLFLYNDKSNSIYDYTFEVYSRWGEKIFATNDVNGAWDGTYKGSLAPSGLYIWRVDALGLDGVYHTQQGKVNLLR